MTQEQNPLEALEAIKAARQQALGKMDHWPWWYDLGYAVACGLLVMGQGLGTAVGMMATAVAIAILVLIMRRYQSETGIWVNGYGPKRARWVAFGLAGLLMVLMGASIWFGRVQGLVWVPIMSGIIAAVMGVVGMRVWMAFYRQDVADLS